MSFDQTGQPLRKLITERSLEFNRKMLVQKAQPIKLLTQIDFMFSSVKTLA